MSFEEILKADEGLRKEEEDNGDPVAVLTVTVAVAMLMPQLVLTEGVLGCCFSSPVPSMLLLLTAAGAIMWDQRELRHAVEGHAHVGMAKALPFVSASLDTQTENGATLHFNSTSQACAPHTASMTTKELHPQLPQTSYDTSASPYFVGYIYTSLRRWVDPAEYSSYSTAVGGLQLFLPAGFLRFGWKSRLSTLLAQSLFALGSALVMTSLAFPLRTEVDLYVAVLQSFTTQILVLPATAETRHAVEKMKHSAILIFCMFFSMAVHILIFMVGATRALLAARILLVARPRLRLPMRLFVTICIVSRWFLCAASPPNSLLVFVSIGVALDIEWWLLKRPYSAAGFCLVASCYPTHTTPFACVCVAIVTRLLLDVLVRVKEDPRIGAIFFHTDEEFLVDKIYVAVRTHNVKTPLTQKAHRSCAPLLLQGLAQVARIFVQHLVDYLVEVEEMLNVNPVAPVVEVVPRAAVTPGAQPKHWPPPLVIPEALDALIVDDAIPKDFVCPLTFALMRQPAITPHGTTYDYAAVASWADAQGRYPANESIEPLLRSDLAPNRVLRNMIEEWVAARCTSTRRHSSPPRIKMRVHRSGKKH